MAVVADGSSMLASVRVASAAAVGATSVLANAASKLEGRCVPCGAAWLVDVRVVLMLVVVDRFSVSLVLVFRGVTYWSNSLVSRPISKKSF